MAWLITWVKWVPMARQQIHQKRHPSDSKSLLGRCLGRPSLQVGDMFGKLKRGISMWITFSNEKENKKSFEHIEKTWWWKQWKHCRYLLLCINFWYFILRLLEFDLTTKSRSFVLLLLLLLLLISGVWSNKNCNMGLVPVSLRLPNVRWNQTAAVSHALAHHFRNGLVGRCEWHHWAHRSFQNRQPSVVDDAFRLHQSVFFFVDLLLNDLLTH